MKPHRLFMHLAMVSCYVGMLSIVSVFCRVPTHRGGYILLFLTIYLAWMQLYMHSCRKEDRRELQRKMQRPAGARHTLTLTELDMLLWLRKQPDGIADEHTLRLKFGVHSDQLMALQQDGTIKWDQQNGVVTWSADSQHNTNHTDRSWNAL